VLKPGLTKGAWTEEEDELVRSTVFAKGIGNVKWSTIAANLPGRIGKQCRERSKTSPTLRVEGDSRVWASTMRS